MKTAVALSAVLLAAQPVMGQDAPSPAPVPVPEEDFGFFGEAARDLLMDFAERMAPALEEMQDQIAPALEDLAERLGRLDAYHPPEVLPNGDIIIRRKEPGERAAPGPSDPAEGAIDL